MAQLITIIACFVSFSVSKPTLASTIVSPVSEYVHAPGKFIAPIPPHSLRVERDVSLEMCAAKCTIYFRTRQFPCYAFEYTAGSRMCVYTNMTTLLIQDGYLGLHDNPSVDFYERSKASYKNMFRKISDSALSKQSSYFHIKQNSSLEECSFHCVISHAHTCMSFSYSHASGTCGLSNTLYSSQSKDVSLIHTTLYDHYQYITAWPCNATLASNYAPHVFASLKYPYMAMQNVNCHVTIQAPIDKTVSLSFPTVYFKQSVCDVIGAGITVHDGADQSAPIKAKICSATQGVYSVRSTSDTMYVRFRTGQIPMAFQGVYEFNNPDPPRNPCESSKCINGATCQPLGKGYNCACVAGFTGVFCETNIDDCASSPCFFGGTCKDEIDDFSCVCEGNFTGKRCEKYLGMCANNPCVHGSCSTTGRYSYACNCAQNYMGKNCDIRFHPCMTKPCTHGSCVENGSEYKCICETGYTGRNCNVDDNNPCKPDPCVRGSCMIYAPNQTFVCVCESGFTGRLCNYVINHCEGVDCGFGHCVSYQTGYKCLCDDQYAGADCRLPLLCQGVDCGNGTCVMNITSSPAVHCRCSDGYEGDRCNKKIDYCDNSPCLHGRCQSTETGYVCVCDKGFAGSRCGEEVNPCLGADCGYGICEATANQTYRCICARGFSGPQCRQNTTTGLTTPNPCLPIPCQHGGVCRPVGFSEYVCECGQENGVTYRGKNCNQAVTLCDSSPCTLGHCVPEGNSYRCVLDLQGVSNSTASPLHIPTGNLMIIVTLCRYLTY
ncbi:fibropellin-1-like [Crassostrea angulata]|uniref:fibropellin-1-like n=1 Tax=Magallana angulata TaxID=2784310 RepID=UPI0022B128EF|nr:fibropellin-1-like [Crassostrea angulata]